MLFTGLCGYGIDGGGLEHSQTQCISDIKRREHSWFTEGLLVFCRVTLCLWAITALTQRLFIKIHIHLHVSAVSSHQAAYSCVNINIKMFIYFFIFLMAGTLIICHWHMRPMETAVAQWLRCCDTNRKVAGSIPASVSGFFVDTKSFRSHYGPGVDSASNRNEYQEYFLGVKAAGA